MLYREYAESIQEELNFALYDETVRSKIQDPNPFVAEKYGIIPEGYSTAIRNATARRPREDTKLEKFFDWLLDGGGIGMIVFAASLVFTFVQLVGS